MKRFAHIIALIILLALSACTLPAPAGEPPVESGSTPTSVGVDIEIATAIPVEEEPVGEDKPAPTNTKPPAVTNTSPAPTAVTKATETQQSAPTATSKAEDTQPTPTRKPAVAFNPASTYGDPKYENEMVVASFNEWASPESNTLPDNQNIRLVFKDGKLYVTGKQQGFSTWWFTYHELEDFYLEMTFDSETCSGSDTYGVIFRGPKHLAGVSYGYVVAFTCDGKYWAFRLDGIDPWDADEFINETKSSYINAGSDRENVLGIRAEGDMVSIIANGYVIDQFQDDEFSKGRFGVFVRPGQSPSYTYRLTNFRYWVLGEEAE